MITAVVPVSPIKSHPDTAILEETIDSIRHHLPDAEIILTFDGVRAEQQSRITDYDEFTRRALWLADHHWGNVLPLIFSQHEHQTGMLRATLDDIRTPLLMYVESDTPLVTDEPIDFGAIAEFINTGQSNLVRLSHEALILDVHKHMFHGTDHDGLFTKTSQYSARPHVATTAFYRRLMETCFTPSAKGFLEDRLHGVCDEAFRLDGLHGWQQYAMHMYTPSGNIKRSYHLDARAGGLKFEDSQTF